jgi:hypothetical protein
MYRDHVPVISAAMREDPATFTRGGLFAVLSIRQPIRNVPAMLEDVDRFGRESAYLFGHKKHAFEYLTLNADRMGVER